MQYIAYPPFDISQSIQNGVQESFNIESSTRLNEDISINDFYGHLKTFPVGKYDKYSFYLQRNNATGLETSVIRFALYDTNFDKVRDGSFLIDSNVTSGQMIDISFPVLTLPQPQSLYIVFGRNDEQNGAHRVRTAVQNSSSAPSIDLGFRINVPTGVLPSNVSAGRSSENSIYYSVIFKNT